VSNIDLLHHIKGLCTKIENKSSEVFTSLLLFVCYGKSLILKWILLGKNHIIVPQRLEEAEEIILGIRLCLL